MISAWYIFSMLLLGLHLRHGVWSMFQSLGVEPSAAYTLMLKKAAIVFAVVIFLGFICGSAWVFLQGWLSNYGTRFQEFLPVLLNRPGTKHAST